MSRLTDEQLTGMSRWMEEPDLPAFAQYCGPLAAAELKERRAADLTSFDVDILKWLRGMLADESFEPTLWESSITVLDRLLSNARGDK